MRKTAKRKSPTISKSDLSKKHLLTISGILMVGLFLLVSQVQVPSQFRSKAQSSTITNCTVTTAEEAIDQEEQRMLTLLNNYRQAQGAAPLKLSKTLTRAATWLSVDMSKSVTLDHTDSLGRDMAVRLTQCGYNGDADAENISSFLDAEAAVKDWGASPGHNANILNTQYTVIGIARVGKYWTTDFGSTFASGDSEIVPSSAPMPSTVQPSSSVPNPGCIGSCQTPSIEPSVIPSTIIEQPEENLINPSLVPDKDEEKLELPPTDNQNNQDQGNQGGIIGLLLSLLKLILEFFESLF